MKERKILILLFTYCCVIQAFPAKGQVDTLNSFIDTTSIYSTKKWGIRITTFFPNESDSSEKKGKIYLLRYGKKKWMEVDSVNYYFTDYRDYTPYKVCPKFIDINNDKVKDIFILKGYGSSDVNRYFDIYIINTATRKLDKIKYKEEIVNPIYYKKGNYLKIIYEQENAVVFICKLKKDTLIQIKQYIEK
jgi:hypothetical protein